ncbi:hypothetical protein BpHYR1_041993 [Brachionus plicatilis]|uniref:Uncharacterized protein n=1 Tax=Brachionus plicatilis TaxID=10195 RepID=A0A3M7QFE0_BRAPC|nr:hypothetical protein BpHYR1_041993 [Brachionus plicatilis]
MSTFCPFLVLEYVKNMCHSTNVFSKEKLLIITYCNKNLTYMKLHDLKIKFHISLLDSLSKSKLATGLPIVNYVTNYGYQLINRNLSTQYNIPNH